MNLEQQLVWKGLALLEESELLAMLRALHDHPDRNATLELVNKALDQGLDLLAIFDNGYNGLFELQYEGCLVFDVTVFGDELVWLTIGFSGALGEVAEFKFTLAADGGILQVEFEGSHNEDLINGFFDDSIRLS